MQKTTSLSSSSLLILAIVLFMSFTERGNAQWVPVNNGLWGARSAAVESGANGVVLAATPVGIYRMENGLPWRLVSPENAFSSLVATSTGAFVGLAGDEIYRSTDNGEEWVRVDSMAEMSSGQYSERIYRGNKGSLFVAANSQIHRSTDDGVTWSTIPDTFSRTPLLAFGSDGVGYAASATEVFLSTDNGETWNKRSELPVILDLASTPSGVIVVGYNPKQGVYVSSDSGLTWGPIAATDSTTIFDIEVTADSIIYGIATAQRYPPRQMNGLYRSTDNGQSWTLLSSIPPAGVSATQDGVWMCLNDSLLRSTDRGQSWRGMSDGIMARSTSWVAADNDGRVYALLSATSRAPEAGYRYRTLYGSVDGGTTWRMLREQLDNGPLYIPSTDNIVVAGLDVSFFPPSNYMVEGSTLHSSDNGQTWSYIASGSVSQLEHNRTGHVALRHSEQYGVDSRTEGITVSSDSGRLWRDTLFFSPNNSAYGKKGLSAMAVLNDGNVLLGVVNPWYEYDPHTIAPPAPGIYRTSPQGDNWTLICDSLVVSALTVDSTDVWIASASLLRDSAESSPGIYRSTDMGSTWSKVYDSTCHTFQSIGSGAFVACNNYASFLTSDRGATWMELPKRLVISGVTKQGTVYALYDNTPYRSTDIGQSWQELSEGLSGKKVSMLAVAPDGDIYASVSGYGIFKLAKPASVESKSSTNVESINITLTPNPVAGETIMAGLELSGSATISISITDILGHTVVTERELRLAGGRNQIPLNLHGLPSGSYFVLVSIGERTMSQRFIRP
jgi:photosystem II stability/assembly factor-like uncharacterized protein